MILLFTSCAKNKLENENSLSSVTESAILSSIPEATSSAMNSLAASSAASSSVQKTNSKSSQSQHTSSVVSQAVSSAPVNSEPFDIGDGSGNPFANLQVNGLMSGIVFKQGEWIYYKDYTDNYALYRMKSDLSSKQKIISTEFYQLNVVGDWIYYVKMLAGLSIYRIKTDGTQETKLFSEQVRQLYVLDDWIYYVTLYSDTLYKAKTDGSQKTKVGGYSVTSFSIYEDWIYFTNFMSNKRVLWKMKTDGTDATKVLSDQNVMNCFIDNGKLYCKTSDNKIIEASLDGSDLRVLVNETGEVYFNKIGNYIVYYSNTNSAVCTLNIKTNARAKLYDGLLQSFEVLDGWIYYCEYKYINSESFCSFYRIHADGSGKELISSGKITGYNW